MEEDAYMEKEGKELQEKIEKATDFFNFVYSKSPVEREEFFKKKNIDDSDMKLLQAQTTAMATYANILLIRYNIARAKRQLPTIARF